MTNERLSVETSQSVVTLLGPGFLEMRYKPTARFGLASFAENQQAREQLCPSGSYVVMIVIPAEVPVDMPMTNEDHYRQERQRNGIASMAVVTDSQAMHMACKLYFTYFPQAFPVKVMEDEFDARAWLKQQLAEASAERTA